MLFRLWRSDVQKLNPSILSGRFKNPCQKKFVGHQLPSEMKKKYMGVFSKFTPEAQKTCSDVSETLLGNCNHSKFWNAYFLEPIFSLQNPPHPCRSHHGESSLSSCFVSSPSKPSRSEKHKTWCCFIYIPEHSLHSLFVLDNKKYKLLCYHCH